MKVMINVSNHRLTDAQTANVDKVVELPTDLKELWGNITPATVNDTVKQMFSFIDLEDFGAGDMDRVYVHIAGQSSAVYLLLDTLKEYGYIQTIPVYAFSVRESIEKEVDGKTVKTSVFNFKGWYRYEDNTPVLK